MYICTELAEAVTAFETRALPAEYPHLWLDAPYVRVGQSHHIVSMAVVIATGMRETEEHGILGLEVGASEDRVLWTSLLRDPVAPGLKGVALAISNAHLGLRQAISIVLQGVAWQRFRVHFMRNVLVHFPKGDKAMVAMALRTIFAQSNQGAVRSPQSRLRCPQR